MPLICRVCVAGVGPGGRQRCREGPGLARSRNMLCAGKIPLTDRPNPATAVTRTDSCNHLSPRTCHTRGQIAVVSLVDRERQWFYAKVGLDVSHRYLACVCAF